MKNNSVQDVLNILNKLSFKSKLPFGDAEVKLHVASSEGCSSGDESYFYIGDGSNRDDKLYKLLIAEPSMDAAWQIYLLFTSSTVMPVFWHGGYIVRDYIFDEATINDIESGFHGDKPLECYDLRGLSKENLLLPEVVMSPDGRIADVYCTYWNDWKGFVRDHILISFLKNGRIKMTQIEPIVLFKYDCGILF